MANLPTGTVTFLFTDIEGSTKLAREHSESWETLRSRHHQILQEAIESNHGFIFQVIGDAFCAAFHTASDAIKAAVKAQQGLQNEAWGECVIRVRIGIHTGEAKQHEEEYQGYLTLSLVQRIMSAGHGRQILISSITENLLRNQLPPDVSLRGMGQHKFKDVPYPVRVFQVLAPDLQSEFPALRALDVFPNNLPTQLTSFIGREKELADVKRLLANTHLLTLIGPGGTGKTRLSLQVAMEVLPSYPHGVWFIELAPVSDPSLVPATTLAALDLPAEVHRPAIDMLCDYLREKEALLILDNCEHLVEACARMVDCLLHAAPRLRILASSREALSIAGEVSYRVPSLELPDMQIRPTVESLSQYEALRLFIDRALAALQTFTVTNDNAPAVAQICHRLDGIPLALELAAVKVRALSVDQIAKRLDDQLRLLTGGSRTALERHQTLRGTLDWSHNLLPPSEQILFRRLSIFVDGWTLEAAESVCADESLHSEDIFDLLDQLVNKSLVSTEPWHAEIRYRMLETVRQYAGEKLINAGEREALRDKHLEYFLNLAETAEPHLIRPEQLEWLDRIEAEHENMRAALEWSLGYERPEHALRLTAALGTFWNMHCYWMEGAKWLERALNKPVETLTDAEKTARARALVQEAILADQLDNRDKMKTSAEASLALYEEGTDFRDTAIARHWVGRALNRFDDPERAHSLLEQSLEEFRNLNDVYWEAAAAYSITLVSIGKVEKSLGDKILQSLELARIAGERLLLAHALESRATLAFWNDELDEAEKYTMQSEDLYDQIGYKAKTGLINLGWLAHARNDYQRAKMFYAKAKELLELIGEKITKSSAIGLLAIVARDEGDLKRAQSLIKEALQIDREVGSRHMTGIALTMLGQVHFLLGNSEESKRNFIEGFSLVKELNSHYAKTESLLNFCSAYAGLQSKVVIQVLGFLYAYYTNILKEKFFPLVKRDVESAITKTRQHLSALDFNLAWAEGEKMTINEALDLALRIVEET